MSKESSRHADTTTSTYIDPGATTEEAYKISKTSRTLARKIVGNETPEDRVRQRCSVAVGDFAMADLLRFNADPVPATIAALKAGAHIITDIRMVQAGIQKKGHASKILCALDFGGEIAREKGITRELSRVYRAPRPAGRFHHRHRQRSFCPAHGLRDDPRGDPPGSRDRRTGGFCQRG